MSRFLKPLVARRTYVETLDLLLDLAVAVLWFTVFTTLVATGAGLLITLVGLPILTATFYLARAAAYGERVRVRTFLGTEIERPMYKPSKSKSVWHRLIAPFVDRTTWKELTYVWLVQPVLGVVNFTVAVTAWALRALHRRGELGARTAARIVGAWCLVAALLFAVLSWAVPPGYVSASELAVGVVLFVPLARLAVAPLAFGWNRHR